MGLGARLRLIARDTASFRELRLGSAIAVFMLASGCASSHGQDCLNAPAAERPMNAAKASTREASTPFRQPSYESRRLVEAVTAMSHAPLDPSYRAEYAALEALAACLERFSAADIAPARVRAAAERLAAPHTTEVARVEAVSEALSAAGGVLTVRGLGGASDVDEASTLAYEAAIGRLDTGVPLLEQRARLLVALRGAANLVYGAQSARRPYPPDEVLRTWEEPANLCDALAQARERVHTLAVAPSHQARAGVADALFAIADVMALDTKAAAHHDELASVRLEAFGLRYRRSFKAAQTVKVALSRTIDVLVSAWSEPDLESWIGMARRSIGGIGDGQVLFEHASIQDAVRTVLNVIIRHSNMTNSCPEVDGNVAAPRAVDPDA